MFTGKKLIGRFASFIIILCITFSSFQPGPVSAQAQDGLKRQVNAESGRVSFISPESGRVLAAVNALGTFIRPQDPALALAKRFGSEFGLRNPGSELSEIETSRPEDGRVIVRYQQNHQGIPVMGGELIVTTNQNGDLYSMNGEVSPNLSLPTQPKVGPAQARDSALQSVAKWYEKTSADFSASAPELWIFDESLLQPSTRPAELVWRMEVTSVDNSMPVRELVLVNAQRGGISLHFNQVDTAWSAQTSNTLPDPNPTETPTPTETPASTDNTSPDGGVVPLVVTTWYVVTTGNDANTCTTTGSPCLTINGAIGKAADGDTIKVATGTYTGTGTEVVLVNKSVTLSGGWNAIFTTQSGMSTIDGQALRRGITLNVGTVIVDHITIQNGFHSSNGGGIINSGTLTLSNSNINGNVSNWMGGGIYNSGVLTINMTTISNNSGGDPCCSGGGGGGGINNDIFGTVILNNSTVSNNIAIGVLGGGILNSGAITINNSTVSGNTGSNGIYNEGGTITVNNSTVSRNTPGGIYGYGAVTLHNSIVANNTSFNLANGINATDHNLVEGDPKISAYLIGAPAYYSLLADSPAIDAGNPATCLSTDQRGLSRPQGSACDIGAYEYITPGAAASFGYIDGSNQRAGTGLAFPKPFAVYVLDSIGSPVSGVTVTFTAPSSGASGTFADSTTRITTAISNSSGIATSSAFTANNNSGNYNVTATIAGVAGTVTFALTNSLPWFVAPTGSDANSCASTVAPCLTINGAISKAGAGDAIKVATGAYTGVEAEVVLLNKSVTLLGGWNAAFTTQTDVSTVDGQGARNGVQVVGGAIGVIDHFLIQNGLACQGAGIHVWGGGTALTLNNSTVSGNTNACSGGGGGVYTDGTTTLNNSIVSGNIGGGVGNGSGTLTLNNSTVSNNTNDSSGGGISNASIAILNNSTISGNKTNFNSGGGISNSGTLTLNNSTVSVNIAVNGGGGGLQNSGAVSMRNTILAGNTANYGADCNGTISSSGYNLIGNNLDCTFSATTGDLVGTSANPIGPRLTPLQDNGGLTFTHALMTGSVAINAGSPAAPGSGSNTCLSADQRGVARPVGGRCDIGAYEGSVPFVPAPLVNTYTAEGSSFLPGNFLCDQSQPNCTNGGNPHADAAHKYALGTYNLYAVKHTRDSIDNNGMVITSTVHYCNPGFTCPYANAFWSGTQMVYGDAFGFPLADDVVAHELTHGVTQYESNLFYFYQSGAINESFSDVWGEYYDQTNGLGTDTPAVKWLMGEDVSGSGAIRSMSNPPAFGDPDKMTSANYDFDVDLLDNGGVHTNSGINNKAVFLMVDGGTFNGKTVSALGWDKIEAIYYEAQSNLLSSGSDYSDLYFALQQACVNLTGQLGITAANCLQVKNALDAVEMNAQPVAGYNPDALVCAAGTLAVPIFQDDMESGTGKWALTGVWSLQSGYASSPIHMLYGDDSYPSTDSSATMVAGVAIPAATTMYLHFKHAFAFEHDAGGNYDGGVLEYSINNGTSWTDVSPLFVDGQNYKGTILNYPGTTNALKGRSAFVNDSHGYVSSRYNLTSLGGQTVKFRWRFATDSTVNYFGWMIDDVQVYNCISNTISGNVGAAGVTLSYTDGTLKTTTSQANGSYYLSVSNGWSGTVTPLLAGVIFTPANRSYSNVVASQIGQNYTATVTLSGNVGVGGAMLSYTDGTPKTATANGTGNYTFTVPYNWSGTVTPLLANDFCPGSQTYTNVKASRTAQNYAHETCRTFSSVSKSSSSFDLSHGWTVSQFVRTVGDVNNDGRDDLIGFGLDGVYVALSNGPSFDPISKWTSSFDLSHGWTVSQYVRTVGDVNNDGRDDLIGFGLDGVYVALSNGSGFGAVSKWTSSFDFSHGWTVSQYVRTVGDVNNDGRDDLIGFGLDGVYVALSNGTSFAPISKWTSSFDLSHGWTVSQFVRTVGDVNNDGRDDLIGFGLDGVYVALSTGSGFGAVSRWTDAFDLSHGWTVAQYVRTVGDVNNDGRDDLVGFGQDGVYIALSTGNSFTLIFKGTSAFDLSHGWTVAQYVRMIGDVDGDGKADLVGFGLDGVYVVK